ncbi:MAG: nucleotidyl transferase AbiEii/AbiGii toxin family protein [Acidobacteriota bacterium]
MNAFLASMGRKPGRRTGRRQTDFTAAVGELLNDLAPFGYEPTLVGGMALVTLGSTRVTRDFDFLVVAEARAQNALVQVFYRHGFELVSRTDEHGNVIRTLDSREVAGARLRIDRPSAAYFFNRALGLRVDLLFDFPIQAREVRRRSTRTRIQSYAFHIASRGDLILMKEIAARDRRNPADLQDLEFLKRTGRASS